MNSRERVLAVLKGEIPDRLPIGDYAVDCDTIEKIMDTKPICGQRPSPR